MAEENLEELFHLECLLCDEPVPPLRVVSGEVEFWLVAMAQSVAESAERWEYVERVSHTDESLLCGVGHGALDAEWMVRLGNPDVVITVALLLFGLGRSLQVMGLRTGYRQAAAWILEHGDGKVVSAVQTPIWQFYLRRRTYECYTLEELQKAYREEGVNYVTLDGRGKNSDVYRSGYLKEVEDTCQPVVVFDNSFIAYIPFGINNCAMLSTNRHPRFAIPS